jgi:hypothetical protein
METLRHVAADTYASAAPICVVVAIVSLAYFVFCRVSPAVGHDKHERFPPSLPFALPLLGHLPQFLWNTEKLLTKAT